VSTAEDAEKGLELFDPALSVRVPGSFQNPGSFEEHKKSGKRRLRVDQMSRASFLVRFLDEQKMN